MRELVATCVKEGMKGKAGMKKKAGMKGKAGGTFAVKSFLVEWSEMIA